MKVNVLKFLHPNIRSGQESLALRDLSPTLSLVRKLYLIWKPIIYGLMSGLRAPILETIIYLVHDKWWEYWGDMELNPNPPTGLRYHVKKSVALFLFWKLIYGSMSESRALILKTLIYLVHDILWEYRGWHGVEPESSHRSQIPCQWISRAKISKMVEKDSYEGINNVGPQNCIQTKLFTKWTCVKHWLECPLHSH